MVVGGTTWVVVADSREARVYEERIRSGELHELPECAMHACESRRPGHRPRATVHARSGSARHGAGERTPEDDAAIAFARRIAGHLEAAGSDAFDRLVLLAPPRMLGQVKHALDPALLARVTAADPHDCVQDDATAIRERLRHVRAGSWRR